MSNTRVRPAITLLLLLGALTAFAPRTQGQQASAPCEEKHPGPSDFAGVAELPGGSWKLTYIADAAQLRDTSAPVVVRGLLAISSVKQKAGKLRCAVLENRSGRVVKAVRLRWAVTNTEGGGQILAKGELPPIEVEIGVGAILKAGLRGADFADFLRPLVKDGVLGGDYQLSVGVAGVEFKDGAVEEARGIR